MGLVESKKLQNVVLEMCEYFKEREELVKLLILAVLSKQHVYILGPLLELLNPQSQEL